LENGEGPIFISLKTAIGKILPKPVKALLPRRSPFPIPAGFQTMEDQKKGIKNIPRNLVYNIEVHLYFGFIPYQTPLHERYSTITSSQQSEGFFPATRRQSGRVAGHLAVTRIYRAAVEGKENE